MAQIANTVVVKVPFSHRHLNKRIKALGGQFNPEEGTWILPDSKESRKIVSKLEASATKLQALPAERIRNIANTAVQLFNALRVDRFNLTEVTENRIVIERNQSSSPIHVQRYVAKQNASSPSSERNF